MNSTDTAVTNDSELQPSNSQTFTSVSSTGSKKKGIALAPFLFIISIHLAALAGFFTFSWKAAFLCLFLHWVTGGVGITLCYHRLLTHRSFMVPKWLEYSLAAVACLACQGGPISWVSAHRLHHAKSDQAGDPHSPLEGFFWAHMGWCLMEGESYASEENRRKLCPDMIKDPVYIWMDRFHIGWTLLLAVGLYFWGGWSFVVWGIFVRTVLVYHSTWLVNSAAHIWGYRTYMSGDRSTNCWWVALLSYGEGWHNNHHAFQYSARHGLKWWEVDTTYMMIQLLEAVGLAKAVRIPSSQILSRFYAPEKNPSSHVA